MAPSWTCSQNQGSPTKFFWKNTSRSPSPGFSICMNQMDYQSRFTGLKITANKTQITRVKEEDFVGGAQQPAHNLLKRKNLFFVSQTRRTSVQKSELHKLPSRVKDSAHKTEFDKD